MKAKDCAERYLTASDRMDALADISAEFVVETGRLIKERRARSVTAGMAVIKEQSDKWKAFARRTGEIKEDGYLIIMRKEFPELAGFI